MNVAGAVHGIATNGKNIAFLHSSYNRIKDIPVCSSSILSTSVEIYKYTDGDAILLVSENPAYEPIQISEGDFGVMGKLVRVIKSIE